MKNLSKLFIVAILSIISIQLKAQSSNEIIGSGTIKVIINNSIMIVPADQTKELFIVEKPHGAGIILRESDEVDYKIIVLPSGKVIFKELHKK